MLHIRRESTSRSGKQSETGPIDSGESTRPPFRSKLLPVVLAASLGFAPVGFLAFRDIARAQPALHTMPHAQSASSHAAGQKASGDLPGRKPSGELSGKSFDAQIAANTRDLFTEGRDTFRFDFASDHKSSDVC